MCIFRHSACDTRSITLIFEQFTFLHHDVKVPVYDSRSILIKINNKIKSNIYIKFRNTEFKIRILIYPDF